MESTSMMPKLTETTQTISFTEDDGACAVNVYATDVVIKTGSCNHNHGGCKLKLKNLVDYNWEQKFYPGQLLATHISGKYLAYSIKAPKGSMSACGMVRVVYSPEPGNDRRALIKGMRGEVQDLAFAHIQNQIILACIDDQGTFYIHEIEVTDGGIRCTVVAEVVEDAGLSSVFHRVMWCPYIPDEDDADDDVARLLLTTHGNIARMWHVGLVRAGAAGAAGAVAWAALGAAGRPAGEHGAPVVDAAFSPDGTALATAAADGNVMFFQVYMSGGGGPRCLHKWQPHGGAPLSCLFFLDNHRNVAADVQFWKFAVTGTENNSVLKIWSCKSWSCVQTITLMPDPTNNVDLGYKVCVDASGGHVVAAARGGGALVVLRVWRGASVAAAAAAAAAPLPCAALSLCLADIEEEPVKSESSVDEEYQNGSGVDNDSPADFDTDDENVCVYSRVKLRLYMVQPKGLQEGTLVYKHAPARRPMSPELCVVTPSVAVEEAAVSSILHQQSQQLKNLLMRTQTQPGSLLASRADSPSSSLALNLMTPDAFSSPGKREEDDPPLSATPDVTDLLPPANVEITVNAVDTKLTSAGSSPSREVQQIMSHTDPPYYKEEEVNPAAEEEEEEEEEEGEGEGEEGEVPEVTEQPLHALYHDDVFPDTPAISKPSDSEWPQISLAQISSANHRKASSDKLHDDVTNNTMARLDALDYKIDQLVETVSGARLEVAGLRTQLEVAGATLQALPARCHHALAAALPDQAATEALGRAAAAAAGAAAGAGAARALEPLAAALHSELAAKLSATDRLLRDNIDKLANSRTVAERLSAAIASSLSEMVRDNVRDCLLQNVAPQLEKAHQNMFRQINHAFHNGTKELLASTEAAARAAAERGGGAAAAQLRSALERHAAALAAAAEPARLHDLVRDATHTVLEKELSWWRAEVRGVMSQLSRAHSPAPSHHAAPDRQPTLQMQLAQVQALLAGGDYNGAFQLALSASDLALVVSACRSADPAHVSSLKQHVLLSLVQQLANDIHNDTPLKHRYLEEAIMNLDTTSAVTREHLPIVIRDLQKQIMSFLSSNPGHALTRQFRVLLMATDALLVKSSV